MNHVVIRDTLLNGWEYGMLRSFEKAIVQETGATVFELPGYSFAPGYMHHFQNGLKRGKYRKHFPKQRLDLNADVAWSVLMGPENYKLDLFKNWNTTCKARLLYLYDTLPPQYELIKRLFRNDTSWDFLITSFNDAVDDLEKITGRKWHCVEQAADADLFQPVPLHERLIHFSSYGRRHPVMHEVLIDFCNANGLYYDYTTHDARHPVADATELYKQYAWHLSHSVFTLSWPVELTNPVRAGHLHPITCRWFEAGAAATILLGDEPGNAGFNKCLDNGLVVKIDPGASREELYKTLESTWSRRETFFTTAKLSAERNINRWTWNERVRSILSLF